MKTMRETIYRDNDKKPNYPKPKIPQNVKELSVYETRKNSFDVYTGCSQTYKDTVYSIIVHNLFYIRMVYINHKKGGTSFETPLNEDIYPIRRFGEPLVLDYKVPKDYIDFSKLLESYLKGEGIEGCKVKLFNTQIKIYFPEFDRPEKLMSIDEEVINLFYNR